MYMPLFDLNELLKSSGLRKKNSYESDNMEINFPPAEEEGVSASAFSLNKFQGQSSHVVPLFNVRV